MLLESTCNVFIVCKLEYFLIYSPLSSVSASPSSSKITNTCRYRVRVRKQLRRNVFYQYDCTALQHSRCSISEWIYHTSIFWCLGSVLSEVLVKNKGVFIIKPGVDKNKYTVVEHNNNTFYNCSLKTSHRKHTRDFLLCEFDLL